MTEPPTPEPAGSAPAPVEGEPSPESGVGIPRWVPVLVGVVLVVIAALAVYTGLRQRNTNTLTEHVQPQRDRSMTPAPPGEPGAGASLVLHGNEGDTTPSANEPVQGEARAVITGDSAGVQSTVRIWARRGMMLDVTPRESMVYVNGVTIGQVRQFDTVDEIYDFAAAGSYTVRIVSPGGQEKSFIVTAADDAKQDVAKIEGTLGGDGGT